MMNLIKEYSKQAERTYAFQAETINRARNIVCDGIGEKANVLTLNEDASHRLMHGILGMSGEAGEITSCFENEGNCFDENLQKEIGDWIWYFNLAASALEEPIQAVFVEATAIHSDNVKHISISSSVMIEALKKWLYYGKPIDREEIRKAMANACAWIWEWVDYDEESLAEILAGNIAKLKKRFPKKFTAKDAIARADE